MGGFYNISTNRGYFSAIESTNKITLGMATYFNDTICFNNSTSGYLTNAQFKNALTLTYSLSSDAQTQITNNRNDINSLICKNRYIFFSIFVKFH